MKGIKMVIPGARSLIFACICTMICTVSIAAASESTENEMEIIWTESDGLRQEIYTSSYRSGEWQDPEKITDDNADNLHPSIDVGPDGRKWAVWTAFEGSGYEIRYSVYSDGEWSEPEMIPSSLSSNIKPSIIVDSDNIPWVVWSGNNGDDDDIYFTRFINGGWMSEQCVHEENTVPDIFAFLDTDEDGRPVTSWNRFQDGGYIEVRSAWIDGSWGPPVTAEMTETDDDDSEERVAQKEEVTLPSFITDTRQVFLRSFEQ